MVGYGANGYIAEVLIGNRSDGSLLFYDVVNVTPTSFTEKQMEQTPVLGGENAGANSLGTAPVDTVSSDTDSVNTEERKSAAGNLTDDILNGNFGDDGRM